MDECTFKPKVNMVPDAMPAAAMYVRAPIFERLSRTHTHAQRDRDAAAAGASGGVRPNANSPGGDGGRLDGSSEDEVSVEERRRRYEEFIARQEMAEERKRRHIAALASEMTPAAQPQLCTKSLAMAEASRSGSFLERVARQTARKEHESLKVKARMARDPECTFKPAINPASKVLPGRTATELSRGDQLKKETSVRLMRLRSEAEQLEGTTFTPAINARSKHAEGRLRISEDPDSYIQRLQAEAALASERARQVSEAQSRAELSECTFHPRTNDAPEYVKRIARSMALARAVRPADNAPAKPEWR